MSNDKIKSLVVPRLFEKVGKKVVNKRNKLGKVFNFAKNKPESAKAMKEIEVTRRIQAELIGRMIVENKFIESTQLNIKTNRRIKTNSDT